MSISKRFRFLVYRGEYFFKFEMGEVVKVYYYCRWCDSNPRPKKTMVCLSTTTFDHLRKLNQYSLARAQTKPFITSLTFVAQKRKRSSLVLFLTTGDEQLRRRDESLRLLTTRIQNPILPYENGQDYLLEAGKSRPSKAVYLNAGPP